MPDRYHLNEYFNRTLASTWGTTDLTGGATLTWFDVRTNAATNSSVFQMNQSTNYGRIIVPANGGFYGAYANGWQPSHGTSLTKIMMPTSAQVLHGAGVIVGAFGSSSTNKNFYEVMYTSWDNKLRIRHWVGTTFANAVVTHLAAVDFTPTRGVYHWIRVRMSGNGTLFAKIWEANETPEPSAWNIGITLGSGRDDALRATGPLFYNGSTSAYTGFVAQHQAVTMTALGSTTRADAGDSQGTTILDTMTTYNLGGLGGTQSGHHWFGDLAMGPEYYSRKVSTGTPPLQVTKGVGSVYAQLTSSGVTNLIRVGLVGPTSSVGQVYAEYQFGETSGQTFRTIMRGTDEILNGAGLPVSGSNGLLFHIQAGGNACGIIHNGAYIDTASVGFTFTTSTIYCVLTQIRNNRAYMKVWRSVDPEPVEWQCNVALPAGINSSGYVGIQTVSGTAGSSMIIREFSANATTTTSQKYGSVSRTANFDLNNTAVRRRRKTTVTRAISFAAGTINGKRVRKSTVTRAISFTQTAQGFKRINFASSVFIGGVLTKVNYLNNLTATFGRVFSPIRRRKTTVTRAMKVTASVQQKRIRKSSTALSMQSAITATPQVIPAASVNLAAEFDMSVLGIRTKRTTAAGTITGTLLANPTRVLVGQVTRAINFGIRVLLPGKILDEWQAGFDTTTTITPNMLLTGEASTTISFDMVATGYVSRVHVGSVSGSMSMIASITPSVKRRGDVSMGTSMVADIRPVRSFNTSITAHIQTSMKLDRPDFELVYADVINERSDLIYYACTRSTDMEIIIEFQHKRVFEAESRTNFVARTPEGVVVLVGYSINKWDADAVLVEVIETNDHPFLPEIYAEFGLEGAMVTI